MVEGAKAEVDVKAEVDGVKDEAMDVDCGEGGVGTAVQSIEGPEAGAEEWRWRIMSLTILPGELNLYFVVIKSIWQTPVEIGTCWR